MGGVARRADALWRAMVYAAVVQLHLVDNPLLLRPLRCEDVKPRPSGHWGTVPGTSWALAHVALGGGSTTPAGDPVPLIGAGHAGVVQLALAWLTGDLAAVRPQFTRDIAGLRRLVRSFPETDGLGAEVHPLLPAGDYLGGCLGGTLSFAQGAALDAPERVVVPIIGDGECETPTTAASWLAARELPNGAVLPIVQVNGFRMGGASVLGRMTDEDLATYAAGLGWMPRVFHLDRGDLGEHAAFHHLFTGAVHDAVQDKRPVIFLRCVKGWSGPAAVGGRAVLGTADLHKTPLTMAHSDREQRQQLGDWLVSYRPWDLFDGGGQPADALAAALSTTHIHQLNRTRPGPLSDHRLERDRRYESFADAVRDVLRAHAEHRQLRAFSPDELASNRLGALAREPWTIEVLAEEVLLGWLKGWTASGRCGVIISYEAFAPLLTAGLVASLKQQRLASTPAMEPSLNVLLTSYGWHNVYTHGDPSLPTALLAVEDPAVRMFTPADPRRTAAALDDALNSTGRVNVVLTGKHPTPAHPPDTLPEEQSSGLAIWPHLSDHGEPDLTIVTAGDLPAATASEAVPLIRQAHRCRVRVVNIHELTALGDPTWRPDGLTGSGVGHYFGHHAAILFVTLGHAAAIWGLLGGRLDRPVEVIGWREPAAPMPPQQLAATASLNVPGLRHAADRLLSTEKGVG